MSQPNFDAWKENRASNETVIHRYFKESDKGTSNIDLSKTDCFHPDKDRTMLLSKGKHRSLTFLTNVLHHHC